MRKQRLRTKLMVHFRDTAEGESSWLQTMARPILSFLLSITMRFGQPGGVVVMLATAGFSPRIRNLLRQWRQDAQLHKLARTRKT